MANGTFLDIPGKVVIAAFVIIGVFLGVAFGLYHCNFGGPATATANSAYFLKVADALINGAIVGVFLAVLRTIFELPKLLRKQ
ncbi:hypothetical protein [Bradyrhizobium sp. McL0615]|uniref:hypothetical protein n=1 Tax=Bradyrhizobium sp. McL0615 TaxID=3415673 RepID=UPI003CF18C72